MNFCWCAYCYHMLSIHLHRQCKWSLTITIAPPEEISPCYGDSLPQLSNGFILMVSLYSVPMPLSGAV